MSEGRANELRIAENRRTRKYSRGELVRRIAWAVVGPLFRWSPRLAHGWRRALLRVFGARIGRAVHVYPSARIFAPWQLEIGDESAVGEGVVLYNLGRIRIGRQVTISQFAHLCAGTHDYTDPTMPLKKPPITVGDFVWICTDAFVGPGVTVGEGAVVGARAVVVRNVAPWTVVAGNPARRVRGRQLKAGAPAEGNQ